MISQKDHNIDEIMKVVKFIKGEITISWGNPIKMEIKASKGDYTRNLLRLNDLVQQIEPMLKTYDIVDYRVIQHSLTIFIGPKGK